MYPIAYEADFNPEPNRWTTFFRPLLAIPWLIVGYVYMIAAIFTHLFAWVAVVILGRYPQWLYNFNSGVIRFFTRVYAWEYLQTDAWPPFGISDDPAYSIRLRIDPAAERQSRLKAFFRILLALPILIVLYAVGLIQAGLAIVAWLTIVFRGYLPEGVNDAMTFVNSLSARASGYVMLLTDDYPPVGVERAKPAGVSAPLAVPQPPPPPPAAA